VLKGRAGNLLVLGLSELNLARLKEGHPIVAELSVIGMDNRVLIFYGKTELDMAAELEKHGLLLPGSVGSG
jgi:hypothetical protein